MAFDDFLDGKCNIYHVEDASPKPAYGIAVKSVKSLAKMEGKAASITEVPCHFHIKPYSSLNIVQNEPHSSVEGTIKLTLPYSIDIRENDIVEDCSNGRRYRAGIPRTIHNMHHKTVSLVSEGGIKTAL